VQLEVVREIVRALSDPDRGVAAQLLNLPRDVEDVEPAAPEVIDGTSDDALVKGEQLPRGKDILVLVTPDGPTVTRGSNVKGEYSYGTTPVACTVVNRSEATAAEQSEQVYYVLRAIVLSVRDYFMDRNETRGRNDVQLVGIPSGLSYGLVQDDGLGALGAVVFTVEAFDKRAQRLY
jgi:hypothetical protein